MTQERSRAASFAIPRAAVDALLSADACTIGAYLTLACHTDSSGQYSTAGLKAIRENLHINRDRAAKALAILGTLSVKDKTGTTQPIVYTRTQWLERDPDSEIRDGPTDRARVRYILPTFDEALNDRIWIGSELVRGSSDVEKPLRTLRDCGTVAARLLLLMYEAQDRETWGGVPPSILYRHYETRRVNGLGAYQLIYGTADELVGRITLSRAVAVSESTWKEHSQLVFDAAAALESSGLILEKILILNRNPVSTIIYSGKELMDTAPDAEPLYTVACRDEAGDLRVDEQGLGMAIRTTVLELGRKVPVNACVAIVPRGYGAMIVGIYEVRFQVANPKNAGVEDTRKRTIANNRLGLEWLNRARRACKLSPLTSQVS